ncbi:MAG: 30S ribosomal protein S8 [Parcubacteria group bacterium]|jgi:small subunit ribosomal protein S8|nr:30S ribosomal protein S8 [Parcubacteria group bacterium]|tara:strand:- start:26195 stop:26584 length:390 start_codon:yes stop_codon:yes gene_type:complete
MTDPISDMLTRIRNAQAVQHQTVVIPFSKLKFSLAKILEKQGIVGKVVSQGRKVKKVMEIELKYEQGRSTVDTLKRISKPGRRIYVKKDELKPIRQGYGLIIISTSQGLMTNEQARKKGLGGEVICEIY